GTVLRHLAGALHRRRRGSGHETAWGRGRTSISGTAARRRDALVHDAPPRSPREFRTDLRRILTHGAAHAGQHGPQPALPRQRPPAVRARKRVLLGALRCRTAEADRTSGDRLP